MYSFRRILDSDYVHIQRLYHRCFGKKVPLELIVSKYATDFSGLKNVGFLAFAADGSPAGYYGVFPLMFRLDEGVVLAAQSGDTMTDPDHQKKGLFVTLAHKTYELAKQEGVRFVFGFPNENSYPGFKNKLGWEFFDSMQRIQFSTGGLPFCEAASKYPWMARPYSKWSSRKLSKLSTPFEQVAFQSPSTQLGVDWSPSFFRYKKKANPIFSIEVNGFHLMAKADGHLLIGNVAKFSSEKLDQFRPTLERFGKALGASKVNLSLNASHWLHQMAPISWVKSDQLPIGFCFLGQRFDPKTIPFSLADFDTF